MEQTRQIGLRELLNILFKQLPVIMMAVVVALLGAFLFIPLVNEPQYESTSTLYLSSTGDESNYSLALKLIADCSYLLESHSVLEQTAIDLKLDIPPEDLERLISIRNPEGTRILELTVRYDDPALAKEIADCVSLRGKEKIAATMGFYQVRIHEQGTYNEEPCNTVGIVIYILIAAVTAAMTYGIFLLLYLLDTKLHSAKEAENNLSLPILAEIPARKKAQEKQYEILLTNFRFVCGAGQIFCVSSCGKKTNRSAVALNLAEGLAKCGKRVLLLDSDFRSLRERYEEHYQKPKGLCEVLNGRCLLEDVLNPGDVEKMDIILAGAFPDEPLTLLGGSAFRELLEDLRTQYDYIIIDTAPIGAQVDAAIVASECDGSILSVGEMPLQNAQAAVEQLKRCGKPILGLVWQKDMK